MAHEITTRRDGTAEAAFALKPAWHDLGAVLDHAMSSKEALAAAQLDWEVIQRPVGYSSSVKITTPDGEVESVRWHNLPSTLANIRSDNGHFLGIVSEQYKIIQNVEAFSFLDGLIENHEMTYESAFSIRGGKKVCLLGRLPGVDTIAADDTTLRYVLLTLNHDGCGAIQFGPTAVRVVCANTYKMALSAGTVKSHDSLDEISISHMGDVKQKLEAARKIMLGINEGFDRLAEVNQKLAQYKMSAAEWDAYLDVMCPVLDERDPDWTELRAKRAEETRIAIRDCWNNERQNFGDIGRTAWAAYNSISEWIDHLPRRGASQRAKAEARFNVCLYGAGRNQKQRALQAACRFAGIEAIAI